MTKVMAMTRLMSMPISCATGAFWAVARIAVPSGVRYTRMARLAMSVKQMARMAICTVVIAAPPMK
jgi:hypothetical protein